MPSYDLVEHKEREDDAPPAGVSTQRIPEVAVSERIERIYREQQYTWQSTAQELTAFFHNMQFTQEQIFALRARGQAAVPINVIYPATEQAVAMLTSNNPRFQATAREDSDIKTAKVVADLMQWIWGQSDGNAALKTSVYDYYVKGRGCIQVFVDPNADRGKGEIKLTEVNPLDVYPDPNSQDRLWRDASHIVVSRVFTREQIESMWPDAREIMPLAETYDGDKFTASASGPRWNGTFTDGQQHNRQVAAYAGVVGQDGQQIGQQTEDRYHERYKVIERYTKVKVPYFHVVDPISGEERMLLENEYEEYLKSPAVYMTDGQSEQYATDNEELDRMLELYEQAQPQEEGSRTRIYQPPAQTDPMTGRVVQQPPISLTLLTKRELIEQELITVNEILEDRVRLVISIGGQLYYDQYLPIKDYPIVPLNNRHERNPYPMSDIGFVRGLQESINKMHMQIVANLSSSNNQKVILPRGSVDRDQIERELNKAGTAVIEADYELGEPVIVGPQAFPSGAFTYLEQLKRQVQQELGIFDLMQGDVSQAPNTYKGTLALDEFGQRRIRSKQRDIEQFLNQLGRVCVQLMPHVYTEEKVIRLVQPNNTVRESVANQLTYDDLGQGVERLNDVTMGTYDVIVVSGSTLPSNRWALAEYYNEMYQMGLIDQVEALKKSDLVDAEGVLERSSYISQLEQAVQQLQDQVKDLEGDLQTATRSEVNKSKRLEVEKFKADLSAANSDVRKATQLYEARLNDQLQIERKQSSN